MTKEQALNILKPEANTFSSLKQAYRKACLKYHPDHGGDEEMMKLINEANSVLLACNWTEKEASQAAESPSITENMEKIIERLRTCKGLTIEMVGTWLWVYGKYWLYKPIIRELGLKWSSTKMKYYYHDGSYKKKSKKDTDFESIKARYGSRRFETINSFCIS